MRYKTVAFIKNNPYNINNKVIKKIDKVENIFGKHWKTQHSYREIFDYLIRAKINKLPHKNVFVVEQYITKKRFILHSREIKTVKIGEKYAP